jgi:hypothetical protein
MLPGNHSSLALNERGPALKVFWSRPWRDGRRVGADTRWPKATRAVKDRLAKRNEPEGVRVGAIPSGPLGSSWRPARASAHHALDPYG